MIMLGGAVGGHALPGRKLAGKLREFVQRGSTIGCRGLRDPHFKNLAHGQIDWLIGHKNLSIKMDPENCRHGIIIRPETLDNQQ